MKDSIYWISLGFSILTISIFSIGSLFLTGNMHYLAVIALGLLISLLILVRFVHISTLKLSKSKIIYLCSMLDAVIYMIIFMLQPVSSNGLLMIYYCLIIFINLLLCWHFKPYYPQ